jgi:hypothetical protein
MQKKSKKYSVGGIMSLSDNSEEMTLVPVTDNIMRKELFKKLVKKEKAPEPVNMTKSKEFDIGTSFNTTGGVKKGGKVKGCGVALRGYGKAMKGSK